MVPSGSFEGERLSGIVLDGGSDWQMVHGDGATTLDVRLVLQTGDGALIGMTYTGIRHGPPEVMARIAKGEAVDPGSYYFRTSASFTTSDARYGGSIAFLRWGSGIGWRGGRSTACSSCSQCHRDPRCYRGPRLASNPVFSARPW